MQTSPAAADDAVCHDVDGSGSEEGTHNRAERSTPAATPGTGRSKTSHSWLPESKTWRAYGLNDGLSGRKKNYVGVCKFFFLVL